MRSGAAHRRSGRTTTLQERLSRVRCSLDQIDSKLLALLHDRLELVREVGLIKERLSRGSWAPAREKEVLDRISRENRGRFPERALRQIFREIFSISRQQESPIRVAYYGLPGSLTHAAAAEQFGSSTHYEAAGSIEEVFDRVSQGQVDYCVVPPEVSCEGIVSHSLEMFLLSDLKICAEHYLTLDLVLASPRSRNRIERVLLQPQVLGLVRDWIGLNLPSAKVEIATGSAEAAAATVADPRSACITQGFTAHHFGLKTLVDRVPYGPARRLRFFTGGLVLPPATRYDKTTVAFSLADRVGVLEESLRAFRKRKINLAFLESYPPSRANPTVTFFADIVGHLEEPSIIQAVEELRRSSSFVKVLGSYPVFETE